ncbi:NAD+ synthase (glutamine-hydrolysing) [Thiogranum longum]|uniref:Glutamine-dependent NAD(+) synthetase n=1 Tax=Thiogranum longum TaxID=1537524 RepID=A0A4R1HJE7_9GAMM|nr:NAD+ synthase [Thiogranum longum]TCK17342.1 NAD+ synthase (glutamine-hydrolysing) [Thiogranum longum]
MSTRPRASALRLVMAQINLCVGDVPGNVSRVIACATRARDELSADLIVFPELTLTGYPPEDLLLRPALHEMVSEGLDRLCAEVQGIHLLVGHPEQTPAGRFNSASVIYQGEMVACCRKRHLPNYNVFDEKRYFVAGDGFCVAKVAGIHIGVTICEDIWTPEPARAAADAGAQLLVNLNASPFHTGKSNEREAVVAERVGETDCPVVYVNLAGGQDELVFDGESFVLDRHAATAVRAPACEEGLYPVDFAPGDSGIEVLPGEVSARADEEASIYKVLVLGVRDYIEKNRFSGAIIGLSGGIDSALTLAIAVDAIGADRVQAVMMPSRYTAEMSLEDARAEAEALGVAYQEISIEPPFNSFLDVLSDALAGTQPDATEENIQARCRGVILMALSNKQGRILLTTGNKSEMSVGYATLYGDMAGGFAPIKDVPKLLVYRLSEYRNSIAPVIPRRVIERPPSAELAPDQKDEDSLPPYEFLDPVLEGYIEQDLGVRELIALGFEAEMVRRVATLVDRNEYKRRQAPPGIRISKRAFGRDRRYPITSGFLNAQLRRNGK